MAICSVAIHFRYAFGMIQPSNNDLHGTRSTLITHRHIEVFRAVMTAGSVTHAAALLSSSQPTVSRELARLEHLLAYPLFERSQGRLRPNARALALWDEVQISWRGLERVVERAVALGQSQEAQLSVLCLPALAHALLPGALARLLQAQPQLRVSITPQESPLLEEWMSAQRFDLGLSEQPGTPVGVQALPLLTLDEVAVLPAGHPLAAQAVLRLQDFAGQQFISLAADDPYGRQIDQLFAEEGVVRQLHLQTHSAVAVCALVQQGLGLAIVNPFTALAMAGSGLVLRRLAFSIPFSITLLRPLYRPTMPETQALVQCLQAQAQEVTAKLHRLLEPPSAVPR